MNQRALNVGESITIQLASSLTGRDLTTYQENIVCFYVLKTAESKPVK